MHIAPTCLYVSFFVLFFSINPTWYPSVPLGRIAQDLQMNLMLFLAIHETSNVVNKLFFQNGSTLNLICSRKVHQSSTVVKFPGPNFFAALFLFFVFVFFGNFHEKFRDTTMPDFPLTETSHLRLKGVTLSHTVFFSRYFHGYL